MSHTVEDVETLRFLNQPLAVSSEPGMDTMDAEFRAICDVAHKGDHVAAGELIEPLLADGVYDLRLVTIYFVARFVRIGLGMLAPILTGVEALAGPNLEAFGPKRRREQHLDKRVAWCFATLSDQITYHRVKSTSQWERWTRSVSPADVEEIVKQARTVTPALDRDQRAQAANALGAFIACLEETIHALQPAAEEEASPQLAASSDAPAGESPSGPEPRAEAKAALGTSMQLEVSIHFQALARKLEAFEQLVRGDHFERAALVSADITRELEAFDPRQYFPEFFSRYGRLYHRYIDQLAPYWGSEGSPHHHALTQLYQVDLAAFVEAAED